MRSTEISNIPEDQDIFLIDNLTGQSYNLRDSDPYSFTSEAGLLTDRFKVVFQEPSTLAIDEVTPDNIVIHVNQIEDKLHIKGLDNEAEHVFIYNMLGQTVKKFGEINNQILENGISIRNLNTGVYIVSIKQENEITIDKRVIIE